MAPPSPSTGTTGIEDPAGKILSPRSHRVAARVAEAKSGGSIRRNRPSPTLRFKRESHAYVPSPDGEPRAAARAAGRGRRRRQAGRQEGVREEGRYQAHPRLAAGAAQEAGARADRLRQ